MSDDRDRLKQHGYTMVEEAIPPAGRAVSVVTVRFRCIGFMDASLNWRYQRDHGLIHDVIAWSALDDGSRAR